MKRLTGLLGSAAILLSACSAASLSIAEYAAAVDEQAATYRSASDDLKEEQLKTLEDTVTRLQSELDGQALVDAAISETARESTKLFAGISDTLDQYVRGLEALNPPAAVADSHHAYVDALEISRTGLMSILEDLPGATSFEEIDRVVAGSGFADAQQRVDATCRDLERAIESQGQEAHLRCEAAR